MKKLKRLMLMLLAGMEILFTNVNAWGQSLISCFSSKTMMIFFSRISLIVCFLGITTIVVQAQSGDGHVPTTQLSYNPTGYTNSTMRQGSSATSSNKSTISPGENVLVYVNFTFSTSGKSVYLVYTTNGSAPTKSNGTSVSCSFSNFTSPNSTWVGTIPSAAITSGTNIRYVFYISDGTLANGWGRVASSSNANGYTTSWSEGDAAYSFTVVSQFYSKSTGNLQLISSWGSNTDGTGVAPANFTSNNVTYNIRNNATPTIGAAWTVSGTGSKVIVGDGTNACTLTLPSGTSIYNSVATDVSNNATVKFQNATAPTFGTTQFLSGSVYEHNLASSGGTIPVATWNSNSTCRLKYTANSSLSPSGLNQTFGKFEIDCGSQTSSNIVITPTNVVTEFRVTNTNAGSFELQSLIIDGNYVQTAGTVKVRQATGTSSANIKGNFTLSGGTFIITDANGAGNSVTLSVDGTCNLDGGNFIFANTSATSGVAFFVLRGTTNIASGVSFSGFIPSNSGFLFNRSTPGSINLNVAHPFSSGTIRNCFYYNTTNVTGINETYNGVVSQSTVNGTNFTPASGYAAWPTSGTIIKDFTVSNNTGVTLRNTRTVNGTLYLILGKLDLSTFDLTLGSSASTSGASSSNYIVESSTGKLTRNISAAGTFDFPIGSSAAYNPASFVWSATPGITSLSLLYTASTVSTGTGLPVSPGCLSASTIIDNGYWTVTSVGTASNTPTITFTRNGHTNAGSTLNTHAIIRRNSSASAWGLAGTWSDPGSTSISPATAQISLSQTALSTSNNFAGEFALVKGSLSLPSAPTSTNGSRCSTGTVSISATAGAGETIDWYAASGGGSVLTGGTGVTSFITPSISSTTLYYAEARNTTTGCVSATRTAVTATINTPPSAPTAGSASRCGTGVVSISATPDAGETIDWYAASSGGSVLTGGTGTSNFTTTTISSSTNYFAEARNTTTGCTSTSRTTVAATVNTVPSAPTSGSASRCGTGTISISATPGAGETIDWYAASSGGGVLTGGTGTTSFTTPSISSNTDYYAEARYTTTGCISATRTTVTATINTNPTYSSVSSSTSTLCTGSSATITVNGLLASTAHTITYSIGATGGLAAPVTSNSSGEATFTVTPSVAQSGAILSITQVATSSCSLSVSTTNTATLPIVLAAGTWIGGTSTDWNTAANWCGGVPTSSTNVVINSGATNYPNLSTGADGVANSITINAGTLTIGGTETLTISSGGTFTNNVSTSAFSAGSGTTLIFAGAGTINGTFATTLNNLTITTGTVTLTQAPTINGIFRINGGNVSAAPTYGASSTLEYNTTYTTSNEWSGGGSTSVAAGSGVPANVTVVSGTVTLAGGRGVPGTVTVNSSAGMILNSTSGDLFIGGNLTNNGSTWTNNTRAVRFVGTGTSVITNGSGTQTFAYLLIEKTSGTVQIGSSTNVNIDASAGDVLQLLTSAQLDLNGRTLTLSGTAGNIATNGANRTIASGVAGGIFAVTNGTKTVVSTSSGTLVFGSNVTVSLSNGLNFGSSLSTVNGTLQINGGGLVITNPPTYGASSTLQYSSNTNYGVGTEWTTGQTSGSGVPQNVTVSSGTAIFFPSAANNFYQMRGDLTYATPASGASSVALSNTNGGNLRILGSWIENTGGTFAANGRKVDFVGTSSSQSITAADGSVTFDLVEINNTNGVSLGTATSATINTNLTLTNGNLNIGTNNLTFGASATASGTFGSTRMIIADGGGEVRKTYSTTGSFTFPVGDNTGTAEYSPATLNFTSGTFSSAYAAVKVVNSKHPNNSSSTDFINRYWTVTTSGITSPVCTASFIYTDADINGTEGNLNGLRYLSSTLNCLGAVINTGTNTISASGLSAFGDFTAGQFVTTSITAQPSTSAQSVCVNLSTTNLSVNASGSGLTYQWFSSPNSNGSSPTSLGSTNGAQTNTYTPQNTVEGTLYYYCVVTGTCGAVTSNVSGGVTITSATNAGTLDGTQTICASGGTTTFTSTVSGGSWTNTGTAGVANINSTTGVVTPIASGGTTMTYTVTGTGGCTAGTATRTLTIDPVPTTANAGTDQSVCAGATITLGATPVTVGSGAWTILTGTGGNVNSGNSPTSTFTGTTGSTYTIKWETTGGTTCISRDTVSITINPTTLTFVNLNTASATICVGGTFTPSGRVYQAGLTEAGGVGTGIEAEFGISSSNTDPSGWSSWTSASYSGQGGAGNNDDVYNITTGSSLTAGTYYYAFRYRRNGCTWYYGGTSGTWSTGTSGVLTVNATATASAGAAVTTCSNSGAVSIIAGASASNNAGTAWTSGGTGTFSATNAVNSSSYTPSAADILAGSVTLTLTATGNTGCSNATSSKTLTINAAPTASAGTAINTCFNSGAVSIVTGASASNDAGTGWTSSGTGSFSATNTVSSSSYTPSAADITAGSVTLTLTATGLTGCANATSTKTLTIGTTTTSVAPTTAQNITINTNGVQLTVTPGTNTVSSRQWGYRETSGGIITNISGQTGTTYTPNFTTEGAYYVVCSVTYGTPCSTTIVSNEVQINVVSNSITTGAISGSPFCAGATGISVPFTYETASNFPSSSFTAQLSDATGSFASPVTLQSVASTASGSQSISVTIPSNTVNGTGYRIRVVSNSPAVQGTDNGVNLTVNSTSVGGTVTPAASSVCSGSATTVGLSGNNGATIQWEQSVNGTSGWANVTGGSGATSSTYTTPNLSSITYYRASVTNGACAASYSNEISVDISPTSVGGSINSASVCLGTTSGTLTLTGNTGTVTRWESTTAPFTSWLTIASTSGLTSYTSGALSQTTKFRAVVTSGTCASANSAESTVSVDQSNAASSAYSSNWSNGQSDGATGFNAWQLSTTSGNGGQNGFFTGSSDINVSSLSWGLYANSSQTASAVRPFTGDMSTGSTLNFSIDNGTVAGSVGFGLQNSSGENLMEFYSSGGNNYTIKDGNSPSPSNGNSNISFTTTGLNISISYTVANTYSMSVTPAGGGTTVYFTGRSFLSSPSNKVPAQIRFFNFDAGVDGGANYYVNKLSLNRPAIGAETNFTTQTTCVNGTPNSLSVAAYGSGLSYQWYENNTASNTGGTPVSLATSASFSPSTASAGNKYYYCVVTGTCSSVTSNVSAAFIVSNVGQTWVGNTSSNWNTASNWSCGVVPTSVTNVTIPTGTTNSPNISSADASANRITINSGATLTMSNGYKLTMTAGGTFTNNGIFTGGNGTVEFAGAGTVNGSATTTFNNLTTNTGTLTLTTVPQIDGTFDIKAAEVSQAPLYTSNSALIYSTTRSRSTEWSASGIGTVGTTAGYPNNVTITGGTFSVFNTTTGTARAIAGNLTVNSGATFTTGTLQALVTIGGNIINNGSIDMASSNSRLKCTNININSGSTVTLSLVIGGDLEVTGDVVESGTLNTNGRAIFFTGGATQNISGTGATIDYIVSAKSGGSVVLGSNLSIPSPANGSFITLTNATDIIDLNGYTLTLGSSTFTSSISGDGLFKGGGNSSLIINGGGNVGTIRFVTTTPGTTNALKDLTINRVSSGAVTLGSDLVVTGTATLTSGLLNIGSNNLTFGASATAVAGTPTASNMIVATGSGEVRKIYSAAGSFTFPVGDNTGTAEYSPVTLDFTSGTFSSSTYAGVKLVNAKYTPNTSTADFISRYWTVTSDIASPVYTPSFTYADGDITGTETNLYGGRYLSSTWNCMDQVNASTNTFSKSGITAFGDFTAGEFGVTGCCINPTTAGSISGNQTICTGGDPAAFTSVSAPTGGSSTLEYKWQFSTSPTFASAITDIASSNSETYDPPAGLTATRYYRRLAIVACKTPDYSGAQISNILTVTVNAVPSITSQPSSATICVGGTFSPSILATGGTSLSYEWQYSTTSGGTYAAVANSTPTAATYTGGTSNALTVTGSIAVGSGYWFRCVVSDPASGCTTQTSTAVQLTVTSPTAVAGGALAAICQSGTSAQIGGSVGGSATGGTWSGGAGSWTNATNPSTATYTAGASESGSITLTLTTSGGSCGTTTATKTITINQNPTASAGSALSAICQSGTSAAMGGSVGGGATGGTWSGGAGTWSNASDPSTATYTADASETGSITLTLTTSGGSCSTTTATKTITINANPTASAGSALSAICQSGTSAAMGGSVGGGATGGTWSGGTGSWTNASNPSTATYTAGASETGSITLTLTTSGGSCSTTTAIKTITVNQNPTASAGSALSAICQSGTSAAMGGSVGGGATGGTWSGGTGSWTNASNPSTATYTAGASETGSITLTLTTSGGSCSTTTATKTITVNANPTASAGSALSAICQSGTSSAMVGSVGGGATGGTWSGGAGSWTNASNPSTATYTAGASETGSITLTLTTSGGSCSTTTATKTITVNANPTASAGSALSAICQSGTSAAMGGSVGGGATGGTWSGGAGSWTNANNPSTATYTAGASETGSITLTLTTSGGSCSTTTATKTITVNANPTASAGTALSAICQSGTSAAMGGSVSGGATGGTWSGGAGSWTNASNPSTATYTAGASESGSITLTLTTSGGSCGTTTTTKTITINAVPVTTGVSICTGGSGSLAATNVCSGFGNAGTTLSGTWSASPTAVRPRGLITNSSTCSNAFVYSGPVTRNYSAIQFQVSVTGSYILEMDNNTAYDGMAYLTSGSFTPGNCSTGTWIVGADDGGVDNEPKLTATLTSGTTYTLYSTTYSSSTGNYIGSFSWTATPPSGGQLMLQAPVWYTAPSGGSIIGNGTSFNPVGATGSGLANTNTAGTTTYYAACTSSSSCRAAANFVINSRPSPTFTIAASTSTCLGVDVTYTTQSGQSNYAWSVPGTLNTDYSITSGGIGTSSNTVTLKWLTSGSKTVTVNYDNVNNCGGSSAVSNATTVRSAFTSGAISTTGQTICSGGTPSQIGSATAASGGNTVITYSWRSSADGYTNAISGATAATYTPPAGLTTTTSYQRYARDGECNTTPTVSTGTWTVTVRDQFTSGAISTTGQTICSGGTPSQIGSATAASGGDNAIIYSWRSSADGYTTAMPDATSATYTPPAGLTANRSYRRYANDGTCNTSATVSTGTWTVTVNSLPSAPSGTNGSRCGTGTVSISATPGAGETIDWYAASSGGSVLTGGTGTTSFTTPTISVNTDYYAQARNTTTGCVSSTRTTVTASLNASPSVSITGASSICITGTTTLSPASAGTWTSSNDNVATVTNAGVVTGVAAGSATFTFTQTAGGCSNTTGSVTVNANPTALSITGNSGCSSGTITSTTSQNGVSYTLYDPTAQPVLFSTKNGNGSGLSWANIPFDNSYYVVATSNSCSASSNTVNVIAAAVALSISGSTICQGNSDGTISSTTSVSGVNYLLYNSSNTLIESKSGTGSTLTWTGLSAGTGYYVTSSKFVTPNTCTSNSNFVDVTAVSTTALSLTGSNICQTPGGSTGTITSTTSVSGVNYQLYNASNATVQSAQAGTGSALTWSSLPAANGYYVIASRTTSPACPANSSTVNVTSVSNPTALSLTGSAICTSPGGNGTVTSSTSVSGVSYQLYNASGAAGTAKAGTGSALIWSSLAAGSGYYTIATDGNSCQSTSTPSVDVSAASNPTFTGVTGGASELCVGSVASISLTGLLDVTQDISYTIGGTSGTQTASVTGSSGAANFNTIALGIANSGQTLTITSITRTDGGLGCITNISGNNTVTLSAISAGSKWIGGVSGVWENPANWCGLVPTSSTDALIDLSTGNAPVINAQQATVRNISFGDDLVNDILTINAGQTLKVSGTISSTGQLIANNGTIELAGSTAQIISGSMFKGKNIFNLTLSNNSGVSITGASEDTINVLNKLSFGTSNATLATNDKLTLVSTVDRTASVGKMGNGNSISGNVTVERFINTGTAAGQHGKSWQFLAAPISSNQTIKQAWQEGANSSGSNPNPGFGTILTSDNSSSTGFDIYTRAGTGPGIKTWDADAQAWVGPSSTGNAISNSKGYMIFVRGDRSVTTSNAAATTTKMRTSGSLYQPGNSPAAITMETSGSHSIGNPYASAIDFTLLSKSDFTKLGTNFKVFDPTLSGSYGLGGYQTINIFNDGAFVTVTPGGTSLYSPVADYKLIQSGQAFFVSATETVSAQSPATITFTEDAKVDGTRLAYRPVASNLSSLSTNLIFSSRLADGNRAIFAENLSDEVDGNDAQKIRNAGENFGLIRDSKSLAVEARGIISSDDTLHYNMSGLRATNYQLMFIPENISAASAELIDKHLNSRTPISLIDTSYVSFDVSADAASAASDRFMLVFKPTAPLPVSFTSISANRNSENKIVVNWKTENEVNVNRYELERSANGRSFDKINTKVASDNNGSNASYTHLDEAPLQGANFYRVKAIGKNGQVQYSAIVKVLGVNATPAISVYPNPVKEGKVNISFTNKPAGNYNVQMTNSIGQLVYSSRWNIPAGNNNRTIELGSQLAAGMYQLRIVSEEGKSDVMNVQIVN